MKYFLLFFLLVSCGDSPFLNKKSATEKNTTKSDFVSEVTFNNTNGSLRDSAGTEIRGKSYTLNATWTVGPNTEFENRLLLFITNENGARVDIPFDLDMYLWMPGMGHGSFPFTQSKIAVGIYEVTEVFFTMGGYWDLHIDFIENNQIVEEIKWPIDL